MLDHDKIKSDNLFTDISFEEVLETLRTQLQNLAEENAILKIQVNSKDTEINILKAYIGTEAFSDERNVLLTANEKLPLDEMSISELIFLAKEYGERDRRIK